MSTSVTKKRAGIPRFSDRLFTLIARCLFVGCGMDVNVGTVSLPLFWWGRLLGTRLLAHDLLDDLVEGLDGP